MQSTGYFATIYRFGVLICGPKNRVFGIKSGHDFCRCRNSIQVIYFQINDFKGIWQYKLNMVMQIYSDSVKLLDYSIGHTKLEVVHIRRILDCVFHCD